MTWMHGWMGLTTMIGLMTLLVAGMQWIRDGEVGGVVGLSVPLGTAAWWLLFRRGQKISSD